MTPYDKVLLIRERMIEDYTKGNLPVCFKPYFDWKLGKRELDEITRNEAALMMDCCSDLIDQYYDKYPNSFTKVDINMDDNPWQNYEGFAEDKYIVSYLEAIDYEITNLWVGGFFTK